MKILAEGYIIFYDIIMWTCMSYMQMRTNVRKYVHTMPNMHIFILTKFPVKALIQNHNILHQIEFENIIKLFCWGGREVYHIIIFFYHLSKMHKIWNHRLRYIQIECIQITIVNLHKVFEFWNAKTAKDIFIALFNHLLITSSLLASICQTSW